MKRVEFNAVIGMAVEFEDNEIITPETIAQRANDMIESNGLTHYIDEDNVAEGWTVEDEEDYVSEAEAEYNAMHQREIKQ